MKYNNKKTWRKHNGETLKFRSKLEAHCFDALRDADVKFDYETLIIPLMVGFEFPHDSYERIGKNYKLQRNKINKVTYKPDFIGTSNLWIIETKGYFTAVARLKWKLFKKWLIENDITINIFMPTNKTEIKKTIEIIKELDGPNNKTSKQKRKSKGILYDKAGI